jgi:hypothetical protein
MFGKTMLVVVVAAALVVGMACGGDDSEDDDSDDGVSTSAPATTEPADDEESEEPTESTDDESDSGSGESASLPDDACTLLTAEQIATMVPDSGPGDTRADSDSETESKGCLWSSSSAPISMTLTLISLPAEVPDEAIIAGTEADLEAAGATPVSDLGEVAGVVSNRENTAELVAYVKGLQMSLSFSGVEAVDTDQLIALGKIIEENL